MMHPLNLLLVLIATAGTPHDARSGRATTEPDAVSPGDPARFVTTPTRCPTFSWGHRGRADRFDLVVYGLGPAGSLAEQVLRASIDGPASSWTPPLEECLERGGAYAWLIRARSRSTTTAWSEPLLFRVAAESQGRDRAAGEARESGFERSGRATGANGAPGVPEVSEVPNAGSGIAREGAKAGRPNVPHRESKTVSVPIVVRPPRTMPGSDGARAVRSAAESGDPIRANAPLGPAAAAAPESAALSVDGTIAATSFAGNGAELSNVEASGLACAGCVGGTELSDGAVTAAKIGAACAEGELLRREASGWACAALTPPVCNPGDELGCYTGPEPTRNVGACTSGIRPCLGDATWGACTGEVTPAAAETCDGLDNTCDGATDEGDPAELCPPTAQVDSTLCDAGACAIAACEPLWADDDGDYANGCEAPAEGACLDGGVPRAIVAPATGDLVVREFLADPASPLTDAGAEWFEVVAAASVDLNGLELGTAFPAVIDELDSDDCLPAGPGDLLLFARSADPGDNGGLALDHPFGFSLVNGGGGIFLAHGGELVDEIVWSGGDVEAGRARNLPAANEDATANDDPANWCTVAADPALEYTTANFGTPGGANVECP